MDKYKITQYIESFAPVAAQEEWDCSGWQVDLDKYNDVKKIMLCLTVTENVFQQALKANCDLIIAHHPCFYIPINWAKLNIYSAHTNLDKANGGTTDTLIDNLGLTNYKTDIEHDFLRIIEKKFSIEEFSSLIKQISPNARIVNNQGVKELNKIAFCAGSGSEFIKDAQDFGADCLVTGDLKFHTALDSTIVLYDVGHFESEILVLKIFEKILPNSIEILYAKEHSPFIIL